MRILYMTQWFEPEPALKGLAFAKALRERGCEVRVATGYPNYPGGKVYPGYAIRPFRRDLIEGLTVDRLPLYPSHDSSRLGRILNYVTFAASLVVHGLLTRRPDMIYAYHPPLTVALAANIVGLVRRVPVVVEIQDLWPDTLAATGMVSGRRVLGLVGRVCMFVYRRSARLIVQSAGFKRRLVDRGVAADKIDIVLNWADETAIQPRHRLDLGSFGLEGRFNVVFAGTLGLAQGLDVIVAAAGTVAGLEPRVQFIIVGDGVDAARIKASVASAGLGNVRVMPRVERGDVADILAAADVLLVTLKPDPLFEITIPAKTQFYLAMGKPVLLSVAGEAADLVATAEAGLAVPPGDARALAQAVVELARRPAGDLMAMGRAGASYYWRELSFASGMDKTMAVLRAVRTGNSPNA